MFSHGIRMAFISLLLLGFLCLGVFITYNNMLKTTLWPVDKLVSVESRETGKIDIEFIGLNFSLNQAALLQSPVAGKLRESTSRAKGALLKAGVYTRSSCEKGWVYLRDLWQERFERYSNN